MTNIKHPTRRFYTDGWATHDNVMLISLPAIPGVSYKFDRSATAPTTPMIRTHPRPPQGIAKEAQDARKLDEVAAAIMAARDGILTPVTTVMDG